MSRSNRRPSIPSARTPNQAFSLSGGRLTARPAETKSAPTETDASPDAGQFSPTEDEIRVLAYRKWEAAGQPEGDGLNFWLAAESELRR